MIKKVPYLKICSWFIASRALILLTARLSLKLVPKGQFFEESESPIDWFNLWDCEWYINIAQEGYHYIPDQRSNVGFFPLYPWLIRLLTVIGIDPRIAGYLISNLALVGAAVVLWKLIVRDTDNERMAMSAVAFLFLGPVSFFFSIIYTEALFLFLCLACLYFARGERWLGAGICGYLAALTRAYGFLLIFPLLWEFLQPSLSRPWTKPKSRPWKVILCGLPVFGLLTYMGFLWLRCSEPLAYFNAQGLGWGHRLAPFWVGIQRTLEFDAPFYRVWFISAWILGIHLIYFGLYLKVAPCFLIWATVAFGLVVSSTTLEALPRYLSGIVSYYIILGALSVRWPKSELPLIVGSCTLLSVSVTLFVNGYWFT